IWQFRDFLSITISATSASSITTDSNALHGITTFPAALYWIFSNMLISQETLTRLPSILDKLLETIFMSIAATTTAAVISMFLGLMGSTTTRVNRAFSSLARFTASISRK